MRRARAPKARQRIDTRKPSRDSRLLYLNRQKPRVTLRPVRSRQRLLHPPERGVDHARLARGAPAYADRRSRRRPRRNAIRSSTEFPLSRAESHRPPRPGGRSARPRGISHRGNEPIATASKTAQSRSFSTGRRPRGERWRRCGEWCSWVARCCSRLSSSRPLQASASCTHQQYGLAVAQHASMTRPDPQKTRRS